MDDDVLPVVHEGIGAPVYSLAALAGIFLTTARYRRGASMAEVEETDWAVSETEVEAGEDWWK
jgi:hypothetical protein